MSKPRIIIADTDINYIIPLQHKFAEEFFDKVDLETICDCDYFKELMSSPQKADILIISEELYDSSLQRHTIGNIFLMTEQHEEDRTDELRVSRIFKYTSIKEIFNEITGKSAGDLKIAVEGKKEPQIVLVYSACGGVGKTTIALGISACLTKNYKRVLYINAGHLQFFHRILENKSPITAADIYAKLSVPDGMSYKNVKHAIRREIFSYLPPFKASLMSIGLEYKVFERLARSAKSSNEFDFIIIDADSTFDEDKASLINLADRVIIVTTQTGNSVFATNTLVSNVNGMGTDKYLFVCNFFDKEQYNALISPDIPSKFSVNEYVDKIEHYDKLKCGDLGNDSGIQKTAFLIM